MNRKGVTWVFITFFVLGLIIVAGAIYLLDDSRDEVINSVRNVLLDPLSELVDSMSVDDLPQITNSGDFVDPQYTEYLLEFVDTIFGAEDFAAAHPDGYLTLFDVPLRGEQYDEDVWLIMEPYRQTIAGDEVRGVALLIRNTVNGQNVTARVASPRTHEFLADKELCVLPKRGEGNDALFALHSVTGLAMDDEDLPSGYNFPDLIERNTVESMIIRMNFNQEEHLFSYPYGGDMLTHHFATPETQSILTLHYQNTVCFFSVDGGGTNTGPGGSTQWTIFSDDIEYEGGELDGEELISESFSYDIGNANLDVVNEGN